MTPIVPEINTIDEAMRKLDEFASHGYCLSFSFGPSRGIGICWSVDVLGPDFQSFEQPIAANTFIHCVQIAIAECRERGWIDLETT